MKIVRFTDADFAEKLRAVSAPSSLFDPVIEQRTRAILDDVQVLGDAALVELTGRFDGAKLTTKQLAVTKEELLPASLKADKSTYPGALRSNDSQPAQSFGKHSYYRGHFPRPPIADGAG